MRIRTIITSIFPGSCGTSSTNFLTTAEFCAHATGGRDRDAPGRCKEFRSKDHRNYRETRFCDFAPPDETVGVIDVSASGNGSRGIAFLIDSMIVKLDGAVRRIDYRDIRVMETLPSYETPFEDELLIASPAGDIRISDCSMNKFSCGSSSAI